ncbi:porin [Blochmannia endosymbiont of Camponotus sp.]|uniref:porin n=1 Tax=Blochmannia endosymbiont of Camponotus sp. TaxID=700220 RepID=UPI002024C5EB|nr:porin [Blochmannia endosymbiont of Camponotus sp.]URJ31181.1 porin [Blochmannia endosymbiont of Camponotus sp.]
MKLRCFTSLVATMVMASTAWAAEIYNKDGNILNIFGSIIGGHYFSREHTKDGDSSFLRYGFSGKTYVNDKIVGFGMWEHEISLKNVEGINVNNSGKVLLGYAGIKFGDFGSVDYGRNYGVLYDVGSWTDVIPGFGGDISLVDNFLSNRSSNVVTYRNKNLFGFVNGLDFALQYQGKNDVNKETGRTLKTANGEGYGVSASYSLDNGLAASVAYANSKRIAEQNVLDNNGGGGNDNAEAVSFGIKYDGKGMYIAATYGETYNMTPFGSFCDNIATDNIYGFVNKARNVELVAQYQFDFGLRPSVSYLHSKASDLESGYNNFLKKCITVGTSYVFNKNICTTIDYRIDLLNKNSFTDASNINPDDIIALGVAYVF